VTFRLKMYSLYPKSRNNEWWKAQKHVFEYKNMFEVRVAHVYVRRQQHPEAEMFRSMFPAKNNQDLLSKLLKAANIGSIFAMLGLGYYYSDTDSRRWYWLGRVANLSDPEYFLERLQQAVRTFSYFEDANGNCMFMIGKIVQNHLKEREIFNQRVFGFVSNFAEKCVIYYKDQLVKCRKAVDAWTLVGIRLRVVKDIRKLIGMLIWESRGEMEN